MSRVQSIERAFAVLGALVDGPIGVTEVADRADLPKSTAARLLASLTREGVVEQVGSPNPVSVRDWTGSRIPLHAVSSGQVLLAYSPPFVVQRYLGRPMERFTNRTLVTAEALLERMRTIRRDGYTWALEEFDEGISSVAAPVADAGGEVVAAVHLHGPSYRFPTRGSEEALADRVVAAAARISGSLRQAG